MRALLAALVLLAACTLPSTARRLAEEVPTTLKIGMSSKPTAPLVEVVDGHYEGFEALLVEALAKQAGFKPEIVPLNTYEDRITALLNGTVDVVVHGKLWDFTVTEARQKLVHFVLPSYYSAGAALFNLDGELEGVAKWEDMANRTAAVLPGHYILDAAASTPALKDVEFLVVDSVEDAAEMIATGEVDAYVDDSTKFFPGSNLTIVKGVPPILRAPYSVAVAKGRPELADKLGKAMLALASGGQAAPLLDIERKTFIAAGGRPNPDLADLVKDPQPGKSTLYPPVERQCAPVPTDSIFMPGDYEAVFAWNITGVQNWTCADGKSSSYEGWIVNATDAETGKHAGYAVTVPGPAGTHVPVFVATTEDNRTETGRLINVREAGSVDMPAPVDPAVNTYWYRRPAYEQEGVFKEPNLVLYLTKTNTTGGALPPGAGACKEGDPTIAVPVNALFTFYACKDSGAAEASNP